MKFKQIRLGQSVYIEQSQRDVIADKDFFIESCESPHGFIITPKEHLRSTKKHFISIYNVAYGEVADESIGLSETQESFASAGATTSPEATGKRRQKKN